MSHRKRSQPVLSLFAFQDIITSVTGIMILVTLFLALELVFRKEGSAATTARLIEEMEVAIDDAHAMEAQIATNRQLMDELESELQEGSGELSKLAEISTDKLKAERNALSQRIANERHRQVRTNKQHQEIVEKLQNAKGHAGISDDAIAQIKEDIDAIEKQIGDVKSVSVIIRSSPDEKRVPIVIEVSDNTITVAMDRPSRSVDTYSSPDEVADLLRKLDSSTHYVVILIKPSGITNFREIYPAAKDLGFDISRKLLGSNQTAIGTVQTGRTP